MYPFPWMLDCIVIYIGWTCLTATVVRKAKKIALGLGVFDL